MPHFTRFAHKCGKRNFLANVARTWTLSQFNLPNRFSQSIKTNYHFALGKQTISSKGKASNLSIIR